MECWLPRTQIVEPAGGGVSARTTADASTSPQFDNRTPAAKETPHYDPRGPMSGSRVHYCHSALTSDGRVPCGPYAIITDKGLAHYCSRAPTGDSHSYYNHRGEYERGRPDGVLCERPGGREALFLAHNQHPSLISHCPLPGNDQHWQNCTIPSSTTMQKCSLNPDARPCNEVDKASTGPETSNDASAFLNTSSGKVSWLGAAGQRRSRRRYQLWRESRRFLDTCYYGNRDLGAKLPCDLQGTSSQATSLPPPLLPLPDLPDGSSSGSASKPPPPLMPLDGATTSQPPQSYLYPPEVGPSAPSTQSISMVGTTASGQPSTGINAQVPRFMYPLPDLASAGVPGHLHHQHFHNLPDYATYLHHQLHHSPHLINGSDAFRRVRYQLPHFPHLPSAAELNQADASLPSVTPAEALRSHHVNASYLKSLQSLLRGHLQ